MTNSISSKFVFDWTFQFFEAWLKMWKKEKDEAGTKVR